MVKHIILDGKKWAWRDLLRLRREQVKAARQPQATLFELKDDSRPRSQQRADGRYAEPTLFRD
jgi:hypothetical protein